MDILSQGTAGAPPMWDGIWAIVPVKPFQKAKTRLADMLSQEERESLARNLFQRSVGLLVEMRRFAGVLVVSRDRHVLRMAAAMGAHTLVEAGSPELNNAVRRALEYVVREGAAGAFIMHADIPFVTAEDIASVIERGQIRPAVVLVPDDRQDGTNGLFLAPPLVIAPAYGVGSFGRHRALAEQAGAHIEVVHAARMALDVDTPADLERYRAASHAG